MQVKFRCSKLLVRSRVVRYRGRGVELGKNRNGQTEGSAWVEGEAGRSKRDRGGEKKTCSGANTRAKTFGTESNQVIREQDKPTL